MHFFMPIQNLMLEIIPNYDMYNMYDMYDTYYDMMAMGIIL